MQKSSGMLSDLRVWRPYLEVGYLVVAEQPFAAPQTLPEHHLLPSVAHPESDLSTVKVGMLVAFGV